MMKWIKHDRFDNYPAGVDDLTYVLAANTDYFQVVFAMEVDWKVTDWFLIVRHPLDGMGKTIAQTDQTGGEG
jgi:predicted acetyltransferase